MKLGERLLELRKEKHLSQEEVADRLNVTRQTVSKWETDQSVPDFDKIVPICELFGITTNELLTGEKPKIDISMEDTKELYRKKKALGLCLGILGYFISIAILVLFIAGLNIDPIISVSIFLSLCGVSTFLIIYSCIAYGKKVEEKKEKTTLVKQIDEILSILTVLVYLGVSFITGAWHITWLIWIVYALISEIIKLIFMLKGDKNNE